MALNVVKIFTTKLIFSCNLRLLNEDLPLKNRMLAKKDQRIFYLHSLFTLQQSYNNTFLKVKIGFKFFCFDENKHLF